MTVLYTYSHREGERERVRINQREGIEGQQFTQKKLGWKYQHG
jgi:hypothetical protein